MKDGGSDSDRSSRKRSGRGVIEMLWMARPSGLIGEAQGFASMPDRAEVNSAIVRCRARVVPLPTVNERLTRDWHLRIRKTQEIAGKETE